MRRLPFRHLSNLRDLGGYPAEKGRETAYGMLLRSDLPSALLEEEYTALRDMGVTTVIDLRTAREKTQMPCAFEQAEGFAYSHIPLFLEEKVPADAAGVIEMYVSMTDAKENIASVMKTIAHAPSGVIYHCTAGKDRTGVISALLLSIAGVSELDIIADYQVSYTYLRPVFAKMVKAYADVPMFMLHSLPEYIEGFLHAIQTGYGSARAYLSDIGLSGEEIESIRLKLLG